MLLHNNVDLHGTSEVEVLIIIPLVNARDHNLMYGGTCLGSQVCVGICQVCLLYRGSKHIAST